ncbi:hypothetical protein FDP41_002830 [Naegleria fowleri]|uniref:Uncharacterized protein n=1 Tax=Naegleria fowleri TaxID=5763 RepID=A0A6A5BY75_NAEFO|nr:uncharacterized protein FDP41_002830 [Naegleria fowleri]KAF0978315.1 hypothetical protein FDP41_002830 [Naegleria fowleri]CAG4718260.1 unnamed protein product [Naegleria fowleri]
MNVFDSRLKAIPPSREYRDKTMMNCLSHFDKYQECRRSNLSNFYELGQIRPCLEEWETFRWCFKAKFLFDEESKERLKTRMRNVYVNMDKMPWIWKDHYLQYLKEQDRLPKRYSYLVEDHDMEDDNNAKQQ